MSELFAVQRNCARLCSVLVSSPGCNTVLQVWKRYNRAAKLRRLCNLHTGNLHNLNNESKGVRGSKV